MSSGRESLLREDERSPVAADHVRLAEPPSEQLSAPAGMAWRQLMAAPSPLPSDQRQAEHELGLAAALVLATPTAAVSLGRLVNDRRIHPEGAVVLGALLYVVGYRDAAQFWWQFAAGGGNYTSASCLSLLHRSLGEGADADVWRLQAEALAAGPRRVERVLDSPVELLPAAIRADIISRCHNGLDVMLPSRVAAVIHQLPVESADEEHGEMPQVSAGLVQHLADAALEWDPLAPDGVHRDRG
ncbi:hypothetical protein [Streptomyces sp. NPDC088725]|uniref:hypothetical protein n=1 Tax=Streptomyces sp. NPDC088725 TaxID=3365873 RepID=UPI003812DFF6